MPTSEERIPIVREWVTKAENDVKAGVHILRMGKDCPTDTVCFHAQQCVEKYLKAILVMKGIDFPRTHDLDELIALLPHGMILSLTATEARRAVRIARRIRREVRTLLPRKALRISR